MERDKTPEELRAWTRSFGKKSSIIKRNRLNLIEKTRKIYANKNNDNDDNDDNDVSKLLEEIENENNQGKFNPQEAFDEISAEQDVDE